MKDINEIETIISFLDSDESRVKDIKRSHDIANVLEFWNDSKYMNKNYLEYFDDYKEFKSMNIDELDYQYVTNIITFILRQDRINVGLIDSNTDVLSKLFKRLLEIIESDDNDERRS